MPHVSKCPTTPDGVKEGKKRLGCGNDKYGNNQYMCLANTEKVSLVEFCYDGIMGIQSKGFCLEVNEKAGYRIYRTSCSDFTSGCPEKDFFNYEFYNYSSCQNITKERGCYSLSNSCQNEKMDNAELKTSANTKDIKMVSTYLAIVAIPVLIVALLIFFIWLLTRYAKIHKTETTTGNTCKSPEGNLIEMATKHTSGSQEENLKSSTSTDAPLPPQIQLNGLGQFRLKTIQGQSSLELDATVQDPGASFHLNCNNGGEVNRTFETTTNEKSAEDQKNQSMGKSTTETLAEDSTFSYGEFNPRFFLPFSNDEKDPSLFRKNTSEEKSVPTNNLRCSDEETMEKTFFQSQNIIVLDQEVVPFRTNATLPYEHDLDIVTYQTNQTNADATPCSEMTPMIGYSETEDEIYHDALTDPHSNDDD